MGDGKVAGTGLAQTVEDWARRADASVAIGRSEEGGEWVVMMNFGNESPDSLAPSPMVGGSALGADDSLTKALEQALRDVRINPCATCGWEQTCEEGCHT